MMKSHKNLNIGISFDTPDEYPEVHGPDDRFAEFEPESTILAMEDAIRWVGATPKRIGGPRNLLKSRPDVDVMWNISEGYGTRNRESWVPVLCELYGIPCLGSDALTMSISLDKSESKHMARRIGIQTPDWVVAKFGGHTNHEGYLADLTERMRIAGVRFPVFIKPRYEGPGKGIRASSLIKNDSELLLELTRQFDLYQQDVIIESFLPGAEFTLAVTGTPLIAQSVLERGIDSITGIGYHLVDSGQSFRLFHNLTPGLESKLQQWSLDLSREMNILDFARFDFKLDEFGNPCFLEVNPLPTFAIDNHFAILAELSGKSYAEYLGNILLEGLNRILSK